MVSSNGQIFMQAPALHTPPVQDLEGSALEAASTKTLASNAALAATAKAMGAGQKGSGRKRTQKSLKGKKKLRGGAENLNAHEINLPEAGTIRGVSAMQNHLTNVNNLNQIRADASYDKLLNSQPYDPTPAKGGKRTKRTRQKHGRRNNRTHRGRNRKSFVNSRRSRRSVL